MTHPRIQSPLIRVPLLGKLDRDNLIANFRQLGEIERLQAVALKPRR